MMVRKKKILRSQEEGKSRGPLTALKRMVTIPRRLNMDHLKVYLASGQARKWKEIEQMNPMEPRGDERSVMVIHVH